MLHKIKESSGWGREFEKNKRYLRCHTKRKCALGGTSYSILTKYEQTKLLKRYNGVLQRCRINKNVHLKK